MTGKDYDWGKRDLSFGQSGLLFIDPEHRQSKFQPTGRKAWKGIWVGKSHTTPDAVRAIPTTWDPDKNAFVLGKMVEVAGFTPSTPASFILKEGPHQSRGNKTVKEFIVKYNLPEYKCNGQGTQDEQIDGCDPVLEVEVITGKVGLGRPVSP